MPHHTPYRTEFPSECVMGIITIARGGMNQIRVAKQDFIKHAFEIESFALGVTIGEPPHIHAALRSSAPDRVGTAGGEVKTPTAQETEQLRECCVECAVAFGRSEGQGDFGARDWKALLTWFLANILPLILPLILEE